MSLLTTPQYAERCRVSPRSVRSWRQAGRLVIDPATGLIDAERSDKLRIATAQRFRMPRLPAEPQPRPAGPTLADLAAAAPEAAAWLVVDEHVPDVRAAILAVQSVLCQIADHLGLNGLAMDEAVNPNLAHLVESVERRAAALRLEFGDECPSP